MGARQRHSVVVERQVLRADGSVQPGDHNQVVAVWEEDGDIERALHGAGALIDRTGITPLAEQVSTATVTDEYLERMERLRWQRGKNR